MSKPLTQDSSHLARSWHISFCTMDVRLRLLVNTCHGSLLLGTWQLRGPRLCRHGFSEILLRECSLANLWISQRFQYKAPAGTTRTIAPSSDLKALHSVVNCLNITLVKVMRVLSDLHPLRRPPLIEVPFSIQSRSNSEISYGAYRCTSSEYINVVIWTRPVWSAHIGTRGRAQHTTASRSSPPRRDIVIEQVCFYYSGLDPPIRV